MKELWREIYENLYKIMERFVSVYSSIINGLAGIVACYMASFVGIKVAVSSLFIILIIDMILSCWAHYKLQHNFCISKIVHGTVLKIVIYSLLILCFLSFESNAFFSDKFSVCGDIFIPLCCVAEIWSLLANITVIAPNLGVIKIIRKFLVGEIANKMKMTEEQVEGYLSGKEEK